MNYRFPVVAACLCAVTSFAAVAAEETYTIDPTHSSPTWEIRHLGFSTQHGSFGKMTGKVVLDRSAKKGAVDVSIDTTSVRSWDNRLDAVLKGERFFNTEKFPTITFKSTSVTFDGDKPATIDGDLTMVGVTKPVTLKVISFNCGENPANKKAMCGADATATIKRSDWGLTSSLNSGSDEVKLFFTVEAYRADL